MWNTLIIEIKPKGYEIITLKDNEIVGGWCDIKWNH